MLVIDNMKAYYDRLQEIRYSTDTAIGMAEKYAEFFRAVMSDRTVTSDERFYTFSANYKEYNQARWLFKTAVTLAYPEADPKHVYAYWLCNEGKTVRECVTAVLAERGEGYYVPWGRR